MQSCQKDLGSYAYYSIDELQINDVDSLYIVNEGEKLIIKPQLSSTMQNKIDPSDYTFEWFIGIESGTQGIAPRFFSNTINLDTVLDLSLGEIEMYLRVTDKKSGIFALKTFKLAMTNQGYEGWLVLNDDDGNARIDMVNVYKGNNRVYTDIINEMGGNFAINGRPIAIVTARTNDVYEGFLNYVLTNEGGYAFNYDNFNSEATYDFKNTLPNTSFNDFSDSRLEAAGPMFEVLHTNGSVFLKPYAYEFRPAINRVNEQTFRASPFVAASDKSYQPICILFNQDNNAFYRYPGTGINCFPLLFPEIDTNQKKLLYMTYTKYNGGEVFAVLQDSITQKVFLARMLLSGQFLSFDEITGESITKAENFAVSPTFGYLFYSVKGRLYEFDFSNKKTYKMLDLSDKQITMLKFPKLHLTGLKDQYMQMQYDLALASHDVKVPRKSGEFSVYTVPSINRPIQLQSSFRGFEKVVDVAYKERF
ncbi:PKD-like family lipoprotein [Sphingobacteruim zhuxiongii]|uniref:PKD-like family lipoprotein n=1 Tax=Sphingobacterium zhuxiongii TaxID=2662364 RepID=UPI00192462DD|nr:MULTISPECIES: PKD-like family lipoprotein [unclassified Sphingobacterium]